MTTQAINKRAVDLTFNYRKDQEIICLVDNILNIQAMLTLISAEQLLTLKVMLDLRCGDGLEPTYKASLYHMIHLALKSELE